MEKQQAEVADSPMLKFSTYSAGLRQGCFLKVSEPEVHRCGEFVVSLVHHVINMLSLCKIFTDGDSKVFITVHHCRCVTMDLVAGID